MRAAPRPSPSSWRLGSVLVSLLVHGLVLGAMGLVAARRSAAPALEFCVEIAGDLVDAEEVVAPEAPSASDVLLPDLTLPEPPPAPVETVADELPDLDAEAVLEPETRPLTEGPPPVAARVPSRRAPTPPAPAAPAAPPPAPTPVAASAPPSAASRAGASVVERATPDESNRRPAYPPESRRLGEQGIVTLRLTLDAAGQVLEVVVARSSGFPRLDEAARLAAYGWRYRPSRRDGVPQGSVVTQRVVFSLSEA